MIAGTSRGSAGVTEARGEYVVESGALADGRRDGQVRELLARVEEALG